MIDIEKMQLKCRDAMYFLDCHPAMKDRSFLQGLFFSIERVCKRSYNSGAKSDGIRVFWTEENEKKFSKEFAKEFKEYTKEDIKLQKSLISIQVSYKKMFGEEWKYDHIEFWGEQNVFIYDQNLGWQPFSGVSCGSRSFEEMVIELAIQLKKDFGNFNKYDFLTEIEKQNHKDEMPLISKGKFLVRNKKFKIVSHEQLNLRWQKWFKITKKGKKYFEKDISTVKEKKSKQTRVSTKNV